MAKIELSLHKNYVPDWGLWEGLREIYQNAIDEHDKGHRMSVVYKDGYVFFRNEGSALSIKHLLIGFTTKANDRSQRGEKGEGLDLGLLALTRKGHDVVVRTPIDIWKPTIETSSKWQAQVLFINTRKTAKRDFTEVSVKVSKVEWDRIKLNFLLLHDIPDEEIIRTTRGCILKGAEFPGKMFVKGIFVQSLPGYRYGYDLNHVTLDRDRNMLRTYDLQYETSSMLSEAVSMHPKRMGKVVYEMINLEVQDVNGFSDYTVNDELKKVMAKEFMEEHGSSVVIVDNIKESADAEYLGKTGVVANTVMKVATKNFIDTTEIIQRDLKTSVKQIYSWGDLTDFERKYLVDASKRIEDALNSVKGNDARCENLHISRRLAYTKLDILGMLNIVEFYKDSRMGLYKDEELKLSRKYLVSESVVMKILIHEISHYISDSGDGSYIHHSIMEDLWHLVFLTCE